VEGPIHTEYGTHLLLVTERTNCPKLDGTKTKLVQESDDSNKAILIQSGSSHSEGNVDIPFVIGQIALWMFVLIAGGILAELMSLLSP
jgi:hypothetical protein